MEPAACGEMVHVDVKKLGRIPAGGGWRMLGNVAGRLNSRADKSSGVKGKNRDPLRGYHYLHTAIDGHSRLAYSELLSDERQNTAAGFWLRANAWFADCGITVRKVLTDNGSCYRSRTFAEALGAIEYRRTRPYRPQTNGKVERFQTLSSPLQPLSSGYPEEPIGCQRQRNRFAGAPTWKGKADRTSKGSCTMRIGLKAITPILAAGAAAVAIGAAPIAAADPAPAQPASIAAGPTIETVGHGGGGHGGGWHGGGWHGGGWHGGDWHRGGWNPWFFGWHR
jgi:hypothetical protein